MQRTIDLDLIELDQWELHAWIGLLRVYFPRLVVSAQAPRPEPILKAVGTVARLQANALELALAVSKAEELCVVVSRDGWSWRQAP